VDIARLIVDIEQHPFLARDVRFNVIIHALIDAFCEKLAVFFVAHREQEEMFRIIEHFTGDVARRLHGNPYTNAEFTSAREQQSQSIRQCAMRAEREQIVNEYGASTAPVDGRALRIPELFRFRRVARESVRGADDLL